MQGSHNSSQYALTPKKATKNEKNEDTLPQIGRGSNPFSPTVTQSQGLFNAAFRDSLSVLLSLEEMKGLRQEGSMKKHSYLRGTDRAGHSLVTVDKKVLSKALEIKTKISTPRELNSSETATRDSKKSSQGKYPWMAYSQMIKSHKTAQKGEGEKKGDEDHMRSSHNSGLTSPNSKFALPTQPKLSIISNAFQRKKSINPSSRPASPQCPLPTVIPPSSHDLFADYLRDASRIMAIFPEFRINRLKDYRKHPLENYDDTFDPKLDYQHMIKTKSEGYSRWVSLDGSISWLPCTILDYSPESREFTIQWKNESKEIKRVKRLNLLFEGESQSHFEDLRLKANMNRCMHLLSESLKEYTLSRETVPSCRILFPYSQLERIIGKTNLRKRSDMPAMEPIIEEVLDDYMVSIMVFFIRYSIRDSLEEFLDQTLGNTTENATRSITSSIPSATVNKSNIPAYEAEIFVVEPYNAGVGEKRAGAVRFMRKFVPLSPPVVNTLDPRTILQRIICKQYNLNIPNLSTLTQENTDLPRSHIHVNKKDRRTSFRVDVSGGGGMVGPDVVEALSYHLSWSFLPRNRDYTLPSRPHPLAKPGIALGPKVQALIGMIGEQVFAPANGYFELLLKVTHYP
jgi:hypothetical protein